jgi:hypothetical protein
MNPRVEYIPLSTPRLNGCTEETLVHALEKTRDVKVRVLYAVLDKANQVLFSQLSVLLHVIIARPVMQTLESELGTGRVATEAALPVSLHLRPVSAG